MLRILAGEKKGHVLKAPRGKSVRPTAASVRRVLFDILGADVMGKRWLDLYAGSGVVGLEALSRGALECVLVESGHGSAVAARQNIERLGYADRCDLIDARVEKALRRLVAARRVFDIVFLDPPYQTEDTHRCLLALGGPKAWSLVDDREGLVVAQVSSRLEIREQYGLLALRRDRVVGDTRLCFFRPAKQIAQTPEGGPDVAEGAPG